MHKTVLEGYMRSRTLTSEVLLETVQWMRVGRVLGGFRRYGQGSVWTDGIRAWGLQNILNIVPRCGDRKELESHCPHLPGPEEGTHLAVLRSCVPLTLHHLLPTQPWWCACSLNQPWWEYLHHTNSKHHKSGLFLFPKPGSLTFSSRALEKAMVQGNNHSTA